MQFDVIPTSLFEQESTESMMELTYSCTYLQGTQGG